MMNEEYIKRLDFDSDTFEAMKTDMNFILQRMIGSMIEKDSTEGSMTIKIDVNMVTEWIPNNNPDVEGETRMIRKPQFKHKCASAIKINDEKSCSFNNEMELDMNENGCYYLKPVADTTQRTIFDSDFQSGMNKPENNTENAPDSPETDENGTDNISSADEDNDAEIDATEALFGTDGNGKEDSDEPSDNYGYDDPEEE